MDCSAVPAAAKAASSIVCLIQPPDWRIYITPALVLISTFVAIAALINTRNVARRKATLDLIEKVESTDHYRALNATFSRLRRGKGFAQLANPGSEADEADRAQVNDYLNHYELVSVGILRGILDEAFYKSWMRGAFIRDWNAAADFVQGERWRDDGQGAWQYHPQIFCAYEGMARRWSSDAITLNRHSGPPPASPQPGPGDDPLPAAEAVLEPAPRN